MVLMRVALHLEKSGCFGYAVAKMSSKSRVSLRRRAVVPKIPPTVLDGHGEEVNREVRPWWRI
jgi:hypothetical protein